MKCTLLEHIISDIIAEAMVAGSGLVMIVVGHVSCYSQGRDLQVGITAHAETLFQCINM